MIAPDVYPAPTFPPGLLGQALGFRWMQWPWVDSDDLLAGGGSEGDDTQHVVVADRGILIAHATVLPREVSVAGERYAVGGLTRVSVFPGFRGRGHGAAVVAAVTRLIGERGFDAGMLSVDPEGAMERFYARFGSEVASNGRTLAGDHAAPDAAEDDPNLTALRMTT